MQLEIVNILGSINTKDDNVNYKYNVLIIVIILHWKKYIYIETIFTSKFN